MKKYHLLIISFFFISLFKINKCHAQGEANNWYFGSYAGITFNSGTPVALLNGALITAEGCASISDKYGNLLFYTDGVKVYNRIHQQMPNGFGLTGNPSASQSSIIVPKPGNSNCFYIFTVDAIGGAGGFRYSEVDLSLNGGLGDVITSTKNTLLFTPTAEKVAAVMHANGFYTWVIAHGHNNNRYYAYLIDCNGINPPVTSNVGHSDTHPAWGYLTASSNGLKLASAMRSNGFEILDFNNSTGAISNPLLLNNPGTAYGISFSPDNTLLYGLSIQSGQIYQWNLNAGSNVAIISSVQNIGIAQGVNLYKGGAIQQGPDGKLYIPHFNQPYLSVINNPNLLGTACDLQHFAVNLSGRNARLGLPPFVQSFFNTLPIISYTINCANLTQFFLTICDSTFLDSVLWNFDDPLSGINNTSNILNPSHQYTNTGQYDVTFIRYFDCIADTNYIVVTTTLSSLSAGNDIEICMGNSTPLSASGGDTYSWTPTADLSNSLIADPVASPTVTTTYVVTATDTNACTNTDDVVVVVLSLPPADAGPDQSICDSDSATLNASGGVSYLWDTGDNSPSITIAPTATTTYMLTVTDNNNCSETDDVVVIVNYPPTVSAGSDAYICSGLSTLLNATGGVSYSWSPPTDLSSTSLQNPVANPITPVTYTVLVTDANGCTATDDVFIGVYPAPVISFASDVIDGCEPLTISFTDNTIPSIQSWSWNFGDPNSSNNTSSLNHPSHIFMHSGLYTISLNVSTTDGCTGSYTYTDMINVYPNPVADFMLNPAIGSIENPIIWFFDQSYLAFNRLWNFGEPASGNANTSTLQSPTHAYMNEGAYTITLTVGTDHGCTDTTSRMLTIKPDFTFYVPNTFTPNENDLNDFFQGFGTNIMEYQMYIFDRWGKLLFETDDINMTWDGINHENNEIYTQDVYVYKFIIKDINNKTHLYYGHITLLK